MVCSNAICTARRPEEALDAGGDSVPGTSLYHIPGQSLHSQSQDNLVISGTFIMVQTIHNFNSQHQQWFKETRPKGLWLRRSLNQCWLTALSQFSCMFHTNNICTILLLGKTMMYLIRTIAWSPKLSWTMSFFLCSRFATRCHST